MGSYLGGLIGYYFHSLEVIVQVLQEKSKCFIWFRNFVCYVLASVEVYGQLYH